MILSPNSQEEMKLVRDERDVIFQTMESRLSVRQQDLMNLPQEGNLSLALVYFWVQA